MNPRTYVVAPGRRLVLPVSEGAAPGGGNRALEPGETLAVPARPSRFLRLRIAAGDLVEAPIAPAAPLVTQADPPVTYRRPKEG